MIPDPLHPAVVHIPVALAVLIPAMALLGIVVIRQGILPTRSWAAIVLLQMLLVASTWLALETGENEEDSVERVVAERYIEEHEEAAERFIALAGAGLLVLGAGLLSGRYGGLLRGAGVAASLVVLAAGVAVGRSGGELVYTHGAANAYLDGTRAPADHHEEDDHDD